MYSERGHLASLRSSQLLNDALLNVLLTIRGELAIAAHLHVRELVCGRVRLDPDHDAVYAHPAAKLRAAGPILSVGISAMFVLRFRHLGSSISAVPRKASASANGAEWSASFR